MSECENHDDYTICEYCESFETQLKLEPCVSCTHNPELTCNFEKKEREQ